MLSNVSKVEVKEDEIFSGVGGLTFKLSDGRSLVLWGTDNEGLLVARLVDASGKAAKVVDTAGEMQELFDSIFAPDSVKEVKEDA